MRRLYDALGRPVELLLVDDDIVDIMAVTRALKRLDVSLPLTTAKNGVEALDCLRGANGRDKLSWPFVILLDLNMPVMNGIALLEELRNDPMLCHSIVFVMSTSDANIDRSTAYSHNVAGYIVKTGATGVFHNAIEMVARFCTTVALPTR